jgi:hypothetical protein
VFRIALVGILSLINSTTVMALATEQVGNAPIRRSLGESDELLTTVNVHSRVYWREINGNPTYYFKGSPKDLNEAIRNFAKITVEKREIILLPGTGETKTFGGKNVPFDWSVHVPMGLHRGGDSDVADNRATLTIYINVPLPPSLVDAVKFRDWIAQLDNGSFKIRDKATKQIEAIGPAGAGMIRDAIKSGPSAEARDRLERLLVSASTDIRIDTIEFPDGIAVVSVETLLKRCRKEMSNSSHDLRGAALSVMGNYGDIPDEILPSIEKAIKEEKHEYPLRCAVGVASRLGTKARPLLPVLRERAKSDDDNVRVACQHAIDEIEKAASVPVDESSSKTQATVRKEIRNFVEKKGMADK